jgi:hypothetical protein
MASTRFNSRPCDEGLLRCILAVLFATFGRLRFSAWRRACRHAARVCAHECQGERVTMAVSDRPREGKDLAFARAINAVRAGVQVVPWLSGDSGWHGSVALCSCACDVVPAVWRAGGRMRWGLGPGKACARRCLIEEPEGTDDVRTWFETVPRGQGNGDGTTLLSQRHRVLCGAVSP